MEEDIQKKYTQNDSTKQSDPEPLEPSQESNSNSQSNQPTIQEDNLLSMDYSPSLSSLAKEDFIPNAEMDPNEFQSNWGTLNEG